MTSKSVDVPGKSLYVAKNAEEELVVNSLSPLQLNDKNYLTIEDDSLTIIDKFYTKRTFLEKTPLNSEIVFQGSIVASSLFAALALDLYFFSVFPLNDAALMSVLPLLAPFLTFIVIMAGEPSLDKAMKPFKLAKTNLLLHNRYSTELSSWLKNMYGIQVKETDLLRIATTFNKNYPETATKVLTDINTKQEFKVKRYGRNSIVVTSADGNTIVVPGDPQNLMRANVGLKQLEVFTVTEKERKAVKKLATDTVVGFDQKIEFLKTLKLTPENEYTVEHAEKEAVELLESMNLLKKFEDRASAATVKNSFAVLEKELDVILEQARSEVHNRVQVQNFYLNSRASAGVMLKAQKSFMRKLMRG